MLRTTLLLLAFMAILLATSPAVHAEELATFKSLDGKFSVLLPGKPKESNQTVSGVVVNLLVVDRDDGSFMVISDDIPAIAKESDEKLQSWMDGARDGLLQNMGAKLVDEQRLKLADKYPGRAVKAKVTKNPALKDGGLRIHIYAVNGRAYQLIVIGEQSLVESKDAGKFLDSLKLLK